MPLQPQIPDKKTVRRIAAKVRVRREHLGRDQDLRLYGGPSRSTVGQLENHGVWPLRQRTRSRWAAALNWEPDAFERMVRGEEPKEATNQSQPPTDPILDEALLGYAGGRPKPKTVSPPSHNHFDALSQLELIKWVLQLERRVEDLELQAHR